MILAGAPARWTGNGCEYSQPQEENGQRYGGRRVERRGEREWAGGEGVIMIRAPITARPSQRALHTSYLTSVAPPPRYLGRSWMESPSRERAVRVTTKWSVG